MNKTTQTFLTALVLTAVSSLACFADGVSNYAELVTYGSTLTEGYYFLASKHTVVSGESTTTTYVAYSGYEREEHKGKVFEVTPTTDGIDVDVMANHIVPIRLKKAGNNNWNIMEGDKYWGVNTETVGSSERDYLYLGNIGTLGDNSRFEWTIFWDENEPKVLKIRNASKNVYLKYDYNSTLSQSYFRVYGYSEHDDVILYKGKMLGLYDKSDNTGIIEDNNNTTTNVCLIDRTLYKDGSWNTLCLPFKVTLANSPLKDAKVKKLLKETNDNPAKEGAYIDNLADNVEKDYYILHLTFEDEETELQAGVPYIVKWDIPAATNLVNPVFKGVTIDYNAEAQSRMTFSYTDVNFEGRYAPVEITAEGGDNTKLYLGAANTYYFPNASMKIGAQRAIFQLKNGYRAAEPVSGGGVRIFTPDFKEENTSILTLKSDADSPQSEIWYDLQGRSFSGKPTTKGVYIHQGKKVVLR